MTVCSPLQPQSLSLAIAQRLRALILAPTWQAGEEIHDADIAQRFGVSRTPVREAMKLLSAQGLLTADPRKGMCIRCLSDEALQEAQALTTHLHHFIEHHASQGHSVQLATHLLQMAQDQVGLPRP